LNEGSISDELADAAAELVVIFKRYEAATVCGEVGVISFNLREAFSGYNGLDGIAGDLQ
jgi:hypothetical protein